MAGSNGQRLLVVSSKEVDWLALWQYCAQKARTKCTLGLEPIAVRLSEIQLFNHSIGC